MLSNGKILKAGALIVFAMISVGAVLSYKEKGVISSNVAFSQKAGSSDSGKPAWARSYLGNIDAISKASGFSPSQIQNAISKVLSQEGISSGSCPSSSGGISPSHGVCKPPGAGICAGGDSNKKDFCPCSVSGTQGGSVVSMCLQGCCIYLGSSSGKDAVSQSGLSGGQMSQLGMQMMQMLQGLMQGGGGGGGGGGYDPYAEKPKKDSVIDGESSLFSDSFSSDDYSYDNLDSEENGDADSIEHGGDGSSGTSRDSSENEGDYSRTEYYTDKKENVAEGSDQSKRPSLFKKVFTLFSLNEQKREEEPVSNNKNEFEYEFQNIEKTRAYDPKLDELKDPTKSKIYSSLNKSADSEPQADSAEDKPWWRKILDFILFR